MANEPLKININVDDMTWDDMRILLDTGQDPMAVIAVFDRFVEGGAAAVPIARTREVIAAITEAIEGLTNPKN